MRCEPVSVRLMRDRRQERGGGGVKTDVNREMERERGQKRNLIKYHSYIILFLWITRPAPLVVNEQNLQSS